MKPQWMIPLAAVFVLSGCQCTPPVREVVIDETRCTAPGQGTTTWTRACAVPRNDCWPPVAESCGATRTQLVTTRCRPACP